MKETNQSKLPGIPSPVKAAESLNCQQFKNGAIEQSKRSMLIKKKRQKYTTKGVTCLVRYAVMLVRNYHLLKEVNNYLNIFVTDTGHEPDISRRRVKLNLALKDQSKPSLSSHESSTMTSELSTKRPLLLTTT